MHVLTAVRPAISPAEFVKQLKGSSSRFIGLEFKRPFRWQQGYGVFSVSEQDVPRVAAYVKGQKKPHAEGTVIDEWEETSNWNLGPQEADE